MTKTFLEFGAYLSNDYGQDNDRSSGDTDYIYFVPQHRRPAQKELHDNANTSIRHCPFSDREEVKRRKRQAKPNIWFSQGDFNSSKATFSSPPTSPERVNLIPTLQKVKQRPGSNQRSDRASTDGASEGSQIPFNTSVLQQQEQDEREVTNSNLQLYDSN